MVDGAGPACAAAGRGRNRGAGGAWLAAAIACGARRGRERGHGVSGDVAVRACHLANVPVANLVGTQRYYWGAVITLVAAVATLAGAVMLMRSAAKGGAVRYQRRASTSTEEAGDAMSERMIWDALDEGSDPTQDTANPDNKGR